MDTRYESKEQILLNELIGLANRYGVLELDACPQLLKLMQALLEKVYRYAEMDVDVSALLAKHNRLSVDVLLLPMIDELFINQARQDEYQTLLTHLAEILQQYTLDDAFSVGFLVEIKQLLNNDLSIFN